MFVSLDLSDNGNIGRKPHRTLLRAKLSVAHSIWGQAQLGNHPLIALEQFRTALPLDEPHKRRLQHFCLHEFMSFAFQVPSLEHNNKVIGESLVLIKYVDTHFEGPKLLPDDPNKNQFAEELFSYSDTFNNIVYSSFKGDPVKETSGAFDHLEKALRKFKDGPFFLGQLSLVDFAYIPFLERFQIFLGDVFKYDITVGRPNLAKWIEAMNKIDAYKQTKCDPKQLIPYYKINFMGQQ